MKDSVKVKNRIKNFFSGIFMAYAFTCVVFIIYAILLTYTSITEKSIPLVVTITSIIAVFMAGFDAAKVSKGRGWLWGLGAGFVYGIILVFLMFIIKKTFLVDSRTLTLIILSLAGGGLGGVTGINIKK